MTAGAFERAADQYARLVAAELARPVDPRAAALAAAIAARYPGAARAVLFYGSCLRQAELDGLMLDFYLVVSDYRAAYGRGWFALANRMLPPNVFPFAHGGLAAKFAVMSEADFARENGAGARDLSTMARFAQPARLAWAADEAARVRTGDSVARAAPTLLAWAAPAVPAAESNDPLAIWRTAFRLTYAAELRAERSNRSDSVIDADPDRYRRFGAAIAAMGAPPPTDEQRAAIGRAWAQVSRRGRRRQALKLLKASTTFTGGIDYLAWKVNRHAGTAIAIRPWQRRWPVLGALTLLPRLIRGGAIR